MGNWMDKVAGKGKKLELCLVGLENSGKTTLLNILSCGQPRETMPTIGINIKMVKKEGVAMKVWDLGGQERFRKQWTDYTNGSDCIIFVLDASDRARVGTAKKELEALLATLEGKIPPVLVALNKCDLPDIMGKDEVIRDMNLDSCQAEWMAVEISAKKNTNIKAVVEWLVKRAR